ncbi:MULTISPECIES: pyridoxal-phosphate-dependent aminotransferase family protein [Lutispora]|uniref:Aminotransferase class V-fold PLP-dependent enzyme n=1 Tax=Lutispora saccharofermentans TaxID=3024236 RepID=A0ABT1NDQ5_9FIRM|nr:MULTISPECIES: aminotransferase class V-fold PLP-dependent enzyme [Lutispora]MCQ1529395.1 aminotransferase class V-fold PLP-dependent enzyme [Lutispora saccharofermentans]MEA4963670.1 aminotransferase class V-fold PLP-dependent enzyme [Lutispora sp.]
MAYINMSCGQTFLSYTALRRMGQQANQPIYYPAYFETEEKTVEMLKKIYKTDNEVLIITGTGTYAIEMGLRSTFEEGEAVLVINTGIFGAVAKSILEIIGVTPVEFKVEYGKEVDIEKVRDIIKKNKNIKGLYVVHDETTTGAMQPVEELGKLCKDLDIIFAVDAISSIAGVELETDKWGIDLCFGSAQKCMNGPQGIASIAISNKVYEKIKNRKTEISSLSLDLETWRRYHEIKVKKYHQWWKTGGEEPKFTARAPHEVSLPATLVWGLQGALEDILSEGMEKRIKRHSFAGKAVRNAMDALGLERVTKDEKLVSDVVTVVRLPKGILERDFRQYMLEKYLVALGNGEIGPDNVRIGTMGISASPKYILPTISALGNSLKHFGAEVDTGKALKEAHDVLCAFEF